MNHRRLSLSKSARKNRSTWSRTFFRVPAAAVSLLFIGHSAQAANTEYDVIPGQTDLTAPATYTTGGTPGTGAGGTPAAAAPSVTSDVTFVSGTYAPAAFTLNSSQTFGSLNDLSATALTIANTGAAADTLTLGGAGDPGSSVPGSSAGDLLFVGTGANLSINSGAAGTATALGLVLGQSGNFNVAGTAAISSIVSDGGAGFGITKTGAGTLTLSGVNTFTGATTITGGTLSIAADSGLGTAPAAATAGQLTLNGGTLAISANFTLNANRGITLGAGGGTINETSNSSGTIAGIIAGTGSLTVNNIGGGRALTLSGANTFSGGVILAGGANAVQVIPTNSTALGTGAVTLGSTGTTGNVSLTLGGGITVANAITVTAGGTRTIQLNTGNSTSTESGAITLVSGTINPTLNLANSNGTSTLNITGGITGTGNVLFGTGVTGGRTNTNVTISTGSLNNVGTLANTSGAGTGSFVTVNSVIGTNVTSVTQNSSVVPMVLGGANTYTGPTTVTLGTLLYNGSVGTVATPAGAVTVASGGRLGGTGILTVASATVSTGGTLAPGATTGATTGALTLNTTGGLTLNGTLVIGIAGATDTSLTTTGALTLSGATLTINGTPNGTSNYDIANYGTLTGTFTNFTAPSGYTLNYAGTDFGGTSIELVATAVPEPATYVGCLLLLAGAGWTYRRRLQAVRG